MVTSVSYVCKMCGKLLPDMEGSGICECEFCGSRQTVPTKYREKYAEIYNRACALRFKTDFEGAEKLFSQLCEEFPDEPEGYWEKVLCRCGILYEDEPLSGLKVPVCHRPYGIELTDDKDCCTALSLADAEQSAVYRREASALEMLRRDMLERVGTGERYDVYMCCRADGEQGDIMEDGIIAAEIYRQLSQEGMRVFYAPETLGDVPEKDSESYINAAIGCSPVMLVVSAEPDSFASPRFKSEWGRCASAAKRSSEKLIVVCIKDMDRGEVPAELSENMIMDVSGMSFLTELIRSVRRHIGGDNDGFAEHSAAGRSTPEKLIRRMNIFLADEDFEAAEEYSDMILDAAPECWQAHYAKFLAFNGCRSGNDLLLEEVVRSFADDYILRYGYDFNDNDAFEKQFVGMLGDSLSKAVEYSDGDDRLKITTVYERFLSAVRDAVFAREQEKIDDEEKQELDEIRRRHEKEENERQADSRKRLMIRKRFLTYMGIAAGVLTIFALAYKSKLAIAGIILSALMTLLVLAGLADKNEKRPR